MLNWAVLPHWIRTSRTSRVSRSPDSRAARRRWGVIRAGRSLAALCLALAAVWASLVPGATPAAAQTAGDFNLLDIINRLSSQSIQQAMAQYPVPFAIITRTTSKGGMNCPAAGTVVELITVYRAGSAKRVDTDTCGATGVGGHDIEVLVEQVLGPPFALRLTINRLTPTGGLPATAADLTAIVAFPADAFNAETLAAPPYMYWGYSTRENLPAQTKFIPASEVLLFTPNVVAGTVHDIGLSLTTSGAPDSVRYFAGMYQNQLALNPPPPGASILDLKATSLRLTPVPATAVLGLNTSELFTPTPDLSKIAVNWTASAPTTAVLTFDDTSGGTASPSATYSNTLTIDKLPTSEQLSVQVDPNGTPLPTFTVQASGNATIDKIDFTRTQLAGSSGTPDSQRCTFLDVPRIVTATLKNNSLTATFGPADGAVNSPALGSATCDLYDGGGLLGSTFKRAQARLTKVPDFSLTYNPAAGDASIAATNGGDSIGFAGVAMTTQDVAPSSPIKPFPAMWDPPAATDGGKPDHVFAFEDGVEAGTDRSGFRFAVGLAQVKSASYDLTASTPTAAFTMQLAAPNHAKLRLYIDKATATVLPNTQNVIVACDIHDVPTTMTLTSTNFADKWQYTASSDIDAITCSGKIGTKEFQLVINGLPSGLFSEFDPSGHLTLTMAAGKKITLFQLDCYDPEGLDGTSAIFNQELRHARLRAAQVPSLAATWSLAPPFVYSFNTPNAGEVIGSTEIAAQVKDAGSLAAGITSLQPPSGVAATDHYARIDDEGDSGQQRRFGFRVVDLDTASFSMSNAGAVAFNYATQISHPLRAFWDTHYTSKLTGPNTDVDAKVNVLNLPSSINFSTNFSTQLSLTAGSGLNEINFTGDIGLRQADNSIQTTHIDGQLLGLPTAASFALDPAVNGSAQITLSNPITKVMVEASSNTRILNSDGSYRHILLSIDNIGANWTADWGISPNPHASLNTSTPLGPVQLVVSKDLKSNTPSKYGPFTVDGAKVQYSGFAREIDRRYYRRGSGDDSVRETTFMSRLDTLYNSTTKLDSGEDHVIYRKNGSGQMDFLSVRGTGFKCASVQFGAGFQCDGAAGAAGEVTATLDIRVPGTHPFFVGVEDPVGKFLTVQVGNVPDTVRALVGASRAHVDFNASAGDVIVYKGPLPQANDGQDALKVVVSNTPSFVHADWDLSINGGATLDMSNPVEVAVLSQSSGSRLVVDSVVGDLSADWGIETLTTTEKCQLDPPGCGSYLNIVKAFVEFTANPALDGFLSYSERMGVVDLSPSSPTPPQPQEYTPRVAVLMDNFQGISGSAQIEMCWVGVCPLFVPLPNADIDLNLGAFNLDFFDLGGGPANILGDPDYVGNNPWHVWPLLHDHDDHLFPFS